MNQSKYTSLSIRKDILKQLRIYAAQHDVSLNQAIKQLLEAAK